MYVLEWDFDDMEEDVLLDTCPDYFLNVILANAEDIIVVNDHCKLLFLPDAHVWVYPVGICADDALIAQRMLEGVDPNTLFFL